MQLCSEGILTRRQTYRIDSQESLSISFKDSDVHLQLPLEVLKYYPDSSVEASFAPLGPVGPHFVFPDGMIPVSPAVWLCFVPQKKFLDTATLKVPHCFECKSPEDSKFLCFLKAEHEDITRDKSGQFSIRFKEVDQSLSEFPLNSRYAILRDHHFCIYCLAAFSSQEDVLGKVNYCLTILKPKFYPKDNLKIYCILHFNLKDCKEVSQLVDYRSELIFKSRIVHTHTAACPKANS